MPRRNGGTRRGASRLTAAWAVLTVSRHLCIHRFLHGEEIVTRPPLVRPGGLCGIGFSVRFPSRSTEQVDELNPEGIKASRRWGYGEWGIEVEIPLPPFHRDAPIFFESLCYCTTGAAWPEWRGMPDTPHCRGSDAPARLFQPSGIKAREAIEVEWDRRRCRGSGRITNSSPGLIPAACRKLAGEAGEAGCG